MRKLLAVACLALTFVGCGITRANFYCYIHNSGGAEARGEVWRWEIGERRGYLRGDNMMPMSFKSDERWSCYVW